MYASCSGMRIFYYADTIIYSKNAKSSDGREADMNLLLMVQIRWCSIGGADLFLNYNNA